MLIEDCRQVALVAGHVAKSEHRAAAGGASVRFHVPASRSLQMMLKARPSENSRSSAGLMVADDFWSSQKAKRIGSTCLQGSPGTPVERVGDHRKPLPVPMHQDLRLSLDQRLGGGERAA